MLKNISLVSYHSSNCVHVSLSFGLFSMDFSERKILTDFGRRMKQFGSNPMNRHIPSESIGKLKFQESSPFLITGLTAYGIIWPMFLINVNKTVFIFWILFVIKYIFFRNFGWKEKWKESQCSERILTIKLISMRSLSKWEHSKSTKSTLCPFIVLKMNKFQINILKWCFRSKNLI